MSDSLEPIIQELRAVSTPTVVDLGASLEQFRSVMRRGALEREDMASIEPQFSSVLGELQISGIGETIAQIQFRTLKFTEKPLFTYGAEVRGGMNDMSQLVGQGKMPTMSACVLDWITEDRPPTSRLFVGAYLGIVTSGVSSLRSSIHWRVEGTALVGPTSYEVRRF
jgi:hypothetical protein